MDNVKFNILIADGEINDALVIQQNLEAHYPNAAIHTVVTVKEYQKSITAAKPDIVLLNLNLKDERATGLPSNQSDAIYDRRKQTSEYHRAIDILISPADAPFPVIIITDHGSEQVAVDVIKAGALDYIVKSPVAFASMAHSVTKALREWALISEKKRVEILLKESQALIIQQEKLASIGQLAAGVAHEINNPMGYITSNMNTLGKHVNKMSQFIEVLEQTIERCADDAARISIETLKRQIKLDYVMKDLRDLIHESLEGAKRVSKIVQDLKSFSRIEGDESIPCNLNECISNIINMVRNEIKYVAELDLRLGDIPLLVCRPQQIGQVVMNLLINAAQSMTENGVITLTTSHIDNSVVIKVTDTGAGIAPELMNKIFEPFFTTKEVGKGTGLGLAICCDIINKHGGEMSAQSELGKGTTFTITLPIGEGVVT